MNNPAASSGVSPKDIFYFIVASDGVLDPRLRNKNRTNRYEVFFFIKIRFYF